VAYGDAMIPGEGVTEHRPGSPAATELHALFEWMCQKLDGSIGRPVIESIRRELAP
jgi:hypothetical protein